jgi:inhibitor of KinA
MTADYQIEPLGDTAVVVRFGEVISPELHSRVRALSEELSRNPIIGTTESVPAYATLGVCYDPIMKSFHQLERELSNRITQLNETALPPSRIIEIPVVYGGEYGPDLVEVARYHSLCESDVVEIHSQAEYLVYMIGFVPGFPYMGGMSERIATPRRQSPRVKIPAGSVGIAGSQTGIYPLETPGGWQLIGRTPVTLFDPTQNPPTRLRAGDRVRFRPISIDAFREWTDQCQFA